MAGATNKILLPNIVVTERHVEMQAIVVKLENPKLKFALVFGYHNLNLNHGWISGVSWSIDVAFGPSRFH